MKKARIEPREIAEILTKKGVLVTKIVAWEENNANPELALSIKPNQANLKKSTKAIYSIDSNKPNIRKLKTVKIPTTIASPTT
jgi:hypothetical protein|tara:strand:- start:729 stop:977 length:249 start_codon:yes stop_codon:yes gene_type:complete